jgi:hypothetical protein
VEVFGGVVDASGEEFLVESGGQLGVWVRAVLVDQALST